MLKTVFTYDIQDLCFPIGRPSAKRSYLNFKKQYLRTQFYSFTSCSSSAQWSPYGVPSIWLPYWTVQLWNTSIITERSITQRWSSPSLPCKIWSFTQEHQKLSLVSWSLASALTAKTQVWVTRLWSWASPWGGCPLSCPLRWAEAALLPSLGDLLLMASLVYGTPLWAAVS